MVREFEQGQYIALILGGSSGLGLAAAQKLAAHGMGICILHRNTRSEMRDIGPVFEQIQEQAPLFMAFNADVIDAGKRQGIVEGLKAYQGRFRCILHSIARGNLKAIDGDAPLSTDDMRLTMEYMAYSLYDWALAFKEAGLLAADARILAYTSEGSRKAWKHYAAVASAKAALEALIRNMALEWAPAGIRANCLQAGITATASMKRIPGSELLEAATPGRNPFGRMTTPQDVADVVYLLCRDEAAWINGSIIPVDGGEHIC